MSYMGRKQQHSNAPEASLDTKAVRGREVCSEWPSQTRGGWRREGKGHTVSVTPAWRSDAATYSHVARRKAVE